MLYGNGFNSNFVVSAALPNNSNGESPGIILPFIINKNEAGTNYAVKYPNISDDNPENYPLFVVRNAVLYYGKVRHASSVAGFPVVGSTGGGNGGAVNKFTYSASKNAYGYVYDPYVAQMSHVFTNWMDYAKYPDDVKKNFYREGETNNGSVSFSYTASYINTMNKDLFHRDDVGILDVTTQPDYSGSCWYQYASVSANYQNVQGCPGYMGGIILCSADDAEFEQGKYIAIGFKGLYSDSRSWSTINEGVNYNYYTLPTPNPGIFANMPLYNHSFKVYKFDKKYFTRISPNTYVFKDKEILPLSYAKHNVYAFDGPYFGAVTGYVKNDTETTVSLTQSDYIKTPVLYTSVAYATQEPPENCISAKTVKTNLSITENVFDLYSNDATDRVYENFYYSKNNTLTGAFLTVHPFPGCSFGDINSVSGDTTCGLSIHQSLTDIHFGKCLSAFSTVYVGWMNFSALTGMDDNWDNWYNINDCGSTSHWVFYNAYKLTHIPPSWNGLGNVYTSRCMFKGCSALESIPNSWAGLNRLHIATSMFKGCSKLTTLPASWAGLDTLTEGSTMFSGCKNLKNIPLDAESWSHLKNAGLTKMFHQCTSLDFDGYAFIDNVVKSNLCSNCLFVNNYSAHGGMFYECTNIKHYAELTAGTNPAYSAYKSYFC